MRLDYYQRFELAYTLSHKERRIGKRFTVISRFRTYEQASDYLRFLSEKYPGIYFDIKDVSVSHLDKKSSL